MKRLQGKLHIQEGDHDSAERMLKESYRLYKEMVNTAELIALSGDFIDLHSALGNAEKMAEFKEKGKHLVDEILRGIQQPE